MKISETQAIIAGGASGLGLATVRELTARGAKVGVLDRNYEALRRVQADLRCAVAEVDIVDDERTGVALNQLADKLGGLRILINCAGIVIGGKLLTRKGPHSYDDFDRMMKVNAYGTFSLMRYGAERIARMEPDEMSERGVIINTASIAAMEGQSGQTAYAASKAAVVGLTLPAARDLGNIGIRVCTIAPGVFETPILHGFDQLSQQAVAHAVFPKELGDPANFAALAAHICENVALNGEVIRIDAGLRIPAR